MVKYTDEFLEEVYKYMIDNETGITALARHFGVDRHCLRDKLIEKYGYVISRKDGKLEVDSNYFNIINTEHKAYWLGFLTADGYLSKQRGLELCLAETDKEHIKKFKSDLKSKHKISSKKIELNEKIFNAYRITIKDNQIYNDLTDLGFNNHKSDSAFIPFDKISNSLMPHYIRGLMDGDGCIYKNNNKTPGCNVVICTTISCQMIDDITQYIKKELNIDVKYQHSKNRNTIDICIYKQDDVKKFYDWIYKDATVYLDRKYDKFAVLRQDCEKS